MKRIEIAVLIGIVVSIFALSFTTFARDCEDVRSEVVRIHVLANSNMQDDQQLKLDVRDAVLAGTAGIFTGTGSKQEIEARTAAQLGDIEAIAQGEIERQGYDYTARADLVNMFFTTRSYDGVTFPAGYYDAVRITIGEGEGENWWCVMFPPMCIPAATPGDVEQQIMALGETPQYEAKFALVELAETVKNAFAMRGEKS